MAIHHPIITSKDHINRLWQWLPLGWWLRQSMITTISNNRPHSMHKATRIRWPRPLPRCFFRSSQIISQTIGVQSNNPKVLTKCTFVEHHHHLNPIFHHNKHNIHINSIKRHQDPLLAGTVWIITTTSSSSNIPPTLNSIILIIFHNKTKILGIQVLNTKCRETRVIIIIMSKSRETVSINNCRNMLDSSKIAKTTIKHHKMR